MTERIITKLSSSEHKSMNIRESRCCRLILFYLKACDQSIVGLMDTSRCQMLEKRRGYEMEDGEEE